MPSHRDDRGIHATLLEADDEEDGWRHPALCFSGSVACADKDMEVTQMWSVTSQEEAKKEDKYNVDIQKIDAHWPTLR